jgi:predicted dehydrogenase
MKVLIVGLGSIARKHIAALRQIDSNVDVYALRSSTESSFVGGVTNLYDSQNISCYDFDFAIISNPTSEHIGTINSLLQLQIPLFIEKPLSHTLSGLESIVNRAKELNITTYMACNMRFLACLQFIKRQIEKAALHVQEVNVYCGSYLPEWRPNIDFRKNYSANASMGGGVHLDLIHEIDYIYWFFGMPQKTHAVLKNNSLLNISAFDYANYCLEYPDFCVNIILNYYRRDTKRTLEIVLDNDTWLVDLLTNTVYDSRREILFSSGQTGIETYTDQLNYFIKEILTHQSLFNTIDDAYNTLKICLYDIER